MLGFRLFFPHLHQRSSSAFSNENDGSFKVSIDLLTSTWCISFLIFVRVVRATLLDSENVVANIKLRRARHQTIRYNTTDDDPPLTHVVPPISQPNIRFRNVILLSPPHFLQRTHKEETARLPSSCVLSRDELHRRSRDEVSVPSVICSSVDWDNKKTKKKRKEATRRVRLGSWASLDSGSNVVLATYFANVTWFVFFHWFLLILL